MFKKKPWLVTKQLRSADRETSEDLPQEQLTAECVWFLCYSHVPPLIPFYDGPTPSCSAAYATSNSG